MNTLHMHTIKKFSIEFYKELKENHYHDYFISFVFMFFLAAPVGTVITDAYNIWVATILINIPIGVLAMSIAINETKKDKENA